MSNTIPPLLSNSPPPPPSPDDEEDDEFGNFTESNDFSFTCDGLTSSPSPLHSPTIDKMKESTNITNRSEYDEIKAISEDIHKKDSLKTHISNGFHSDVEHYSNGLSNKVHVESDILKIISGQFEKLDLDNLDVEKQICSDLNPPEDGNGLSNCIEDIKDTGLLNGLTHNDNFTSSYVGKKTYDTSSTKKSIEQLGADDIKLDAETNVLIECNTSVHVNGSHKINSDFNIKNTEVVDNTSIKNNADTDKVLEVVDECAESKESIIDHDQQTIPTTWVFTPTDNFEDEKKYYAGSHESSFDDSSSMSQDKSNFSDNTITEKSNTENDVSEEHKESPEEFDDFGDFTAFNSEQNIVEGERMNDSEEIITSNTGNAMVFMSTENKRVNDAPANFFELYSGNEVSDDDEFADFASFEAPSLPNKVPSEIDDEFSAFSSSTFESPQYLCQPSTSQKINEIETTTIPEPIFLSLNEKEAFEKSKCIIQEMYPAVEEVLKDCEFVDPEDDAVFKQLKDVTDTPALSYHWSKSTSQKFLLKALNIDVRNMIFGPTWNPTIPKFAAHMGLQPLEPIKADQVPSTSIKSNPSNPQTYSPEIPNVQFDWSGSGLMNPLEFDGKSTPTQNSDILAPQITETSLDADPEVPTDMKEAGFSDNDDFQEFESYQPSAAPMEWRNILPLRETHISNVSSEPNLQSSVEAWLQPTIVTPELARRKLSIDESTATNITTESGKVENLPESEDDFDNFKMVSPGKNYDQVTNSNTYSEVTNTIVLDTFGLDDIKKDVFQNGGSSVSVIPAPIVSNVQQCSSNVSSNLETTKPSQDDDDEFTDFHFSMPKVNPVANTILLPSVTPLEPTPVYPKEDRTQINWPDPGVTDEELKKFETVFSSPLNFQQEPNTVSKLESPQKKIDDDDEWSDFMSVQKPSPVHKLKSSSEKERTSSPDLTLSVFNLGSIQPTRPPVPVITPQGLVQTKLSTNASSVSPKFQPKNGIDIRSPFVGQQPSIISNQFASQAYNFSVRNYSNSKPSGPSQMRDIMTNDVSGEEEWGEFVSSPLPPKPIQNAWASQTPNIIMNPGHFVQSANVVGTRANNFSANKKSTLSNSFMPELDFIAPKTRTTVSRKK